VRKANRYDIKGKKYINTPSKYYMVDMGLRNARLNFRQHEETHMMENVIYNELIIRGYNVDVGVVEKREMQDGKQRQSQYEVDFIATKTDEKKYIQVTESMTAPETRERELAPLEKIADNYEKIVIAMEPGLMQDQAGIKIMSAIDFLLE
jgi:predicted AAA+ superfamily ATPase